MASIYKKQPVESAPDQMDDNYTVTLVNWQQILAANFYDWRTGMRQLH